MKKNLEYYYLIPNYYKQTQTVIRSKAAFIGEVGSDWPISGTYIITHLSN